MFFVMTFINAISFSLHYILRES